MSVCPSINLNALKNLQSPGLKNISMQPCGASQLTSHPTEMYSRGALVLPIKSTSSNPESAYPHALISATNRLAERFSMLHPIPLHPITVCPSPTPLSKGRMSEKASKSQDHCQSLNPVTQTIAGTDIDAHSTTTTEPIHFLPPPNPLIHTYGVCPPLPFPRE